jgi:iron complex transport system substrate-binding protein
MLRDTELERVASIVVDCGFQLHKALGSGLLESAYEQLLFAELRELGLNVMRQVPVALRYKSVVIENAFKVDLLVENRLVVELKSVEKLSALHGKQVLTYLRVMNLPLGLLMNFGEAMFKSGLRRIANDYHAH